MVMERMSLFHSQGQVIVTMTSLHCWMTTIIVCSVCFFFDKFLYIVYFFFTKGVACMLLRHKLESENYSDETVFPTKIKDMLQVFRVLDKRISFHQASGNMKSSVISSQRNLSSKIIQVAKLRIK